jgi:hypothetical protein
MADLNVKVGLDRSGFQTGLAAMENAVGKFGNRLTGVLAGSFSFAAIGAGISKAIDQGDQLQDLANRFGVAASAIQEIGNAASLSGGSVEDVAAAMNKLARNAGEAIGGNEKLQDSFAKIGLSTQELMGMSPQDLFFALSRAVSSGSLGMEDFAVASALAGRGASTLMETLRMGPEAIQANGQAMGVWSDETIAALSRASDAIKTFQNQITLGLGAVVPLLSKAIERYQDFVQAALLAAQARFNPNLDSAGRADLMEESSRKIADALLGRSDIEKAVTAQTVRNTEARMEQYDREAKAKEDSAKRWAAAMEKMQELDQQEEINDARSENRKLIREAERIRDATPGSKAFEEARRERLQEMNRLRGNAPDFDPREALINRFQGAGGGLTPAALQDTVKNTTVQGIDGKIATVIGKLDALINAAGRFS